VTGWTHLIELAPEKLIAMATERVAKLDLEPAHNTHRDVINMLRHDYSNYDGAAYGVITDRVYDEVLDAIAADFPWLAKQCEIDKATRHYRRPQWARAREYAYEDGRRKYRVALAAAKKLSVGDIVNITWRGPREAEVIEVRRSRIKVSFVLHNGNEQIVDLSADEVTQP
jgi:hypothetical protein